MRHTVSVLSLTCAAVASQETKLFVINDQLNINFLAKRTAQDPDTSIVVSTYSLLTPLTQLLLASQGKTHSELLNVIGVQSEDIMKQLPDLNIEISNTEGITLKEASKIYVNKQYKLNKSFLTETKALFSSEIESVDFNVPSTIKQINSWVEQQTNNKIKDLLDPKHPPSNAAVVLVNAVYYGAKWDNPFNPSETRPEDFHISLEKSVKIPFMHIKADYRYVEFDELDSKIIELPYKGYNARLLLFVPNQIEGLSTMLKLLNPTTLQKVKKGLSHTDVTLSLPKFKIETTTNLKNTLQELGLHTIFKQYESNLTNLLEGQDSLFVSDAKQKAFIEINEEGTEAAAANDVRVLATATAAYTPPKATLKVDKPFYFELSVGSMTLFSGVKIN